MKRVWLVVLIVCGCSTTPSAPERASAALSRWQPSPAGLGVQLPDVGLHARIDAGVLHVETAVTSLTLETMHAGCVGVPVGLGDAVVHGDRVEVARGAATEWVEPRANGIEHGYTFATRPACADASLAIDLRATGLTPRIESPTRVLLADAHGVTRLAYGGLGVVDAAGASVQARFELDGDRIRIVVDDRDARYPLIVDPLVTNEQVRLNASDATTDDQLGFAVAVSADTLVVGAPQAASNAGRVYVFVRSGTTWSQQQELMPITTSDHFGSAVAIDRDTIVVGAPYEQSFVGNAYVFVRNGTSWTQQAALGASGFEHAFGNGVAIHGDTIIVGAPGQGGVFGTAYGFTRAGVTWTHTDTLSPATNANPGMNFGAAVAFDGTSVLIGAPFSNVNGTITGAAYAFGLDSCFGTLTQEAELRAAGASVNSRVGESVSVSNGSAIVGASNFDFTNTRGAAIVFLRTDPGGAACPPHTISWTEQQHLTASDATDNARFGASVSIVGDRVLVGAWGVSNFAGEGYYFTRTGVTWMERTTLVATDPGSIALGSSAALGDTFSALGANTAPSSGATRTGAVYLFDTSHAPNGATCTMGTDCASGFCTDGVCCNVACGASDPNDCQACSVAAGATTDGTCRLLPSGTTCDDASLCTSGDACNATGACVGSTSCTAIDACHIASCSPTVGLCMQTPIPNGTACNDGNGCTIGETCQAGVCSGTPVVCTPADQCHSAGTCNPSSGLCSNPFVTNGTPCNDNSVCTTNDSCQFGTCTGAGVVCVAPDACHAAGTCDPTTGVCPHPAVSDGTTCDDGDGCTIGDACTSGVCGGAPVTCNAGQCQIAGACTAGACPTPTNVTDGTACSMGMCSAGMCVFPDGGAMPDAGTDSGVDAGTDAGIDAGRDAGASATDAASGSDAGAHDGGTSDAGRDGGSRDGSAIDAATIDAQVTPPSSSAGCGCAVPATSSRAPLAIGIVLAVVCARRRRRT
jgi:hypothetical protein